MVKFSFTNPFKTNFFDNTKTSVKFAFKNSNISLKSVKTFTSSPKSDIDFYVKFTSTTASSIYPIGIAIIGSNFRIL
jgi:hypothetical protein